MNSFYDPNVIKKATFPKWYWLWLWMFPSYVNLLTDSVVFYRKVFGRIYITEIVTAPLVKEEDK